MASGRKVGIIIISDDILNGNLSDAHSTKIIEKCISFGLEICIISIIPFERLSEIIREYSRKYDVVFTTGGIGIDLDRDKTYSIIAEAFDKTLVYDNRLNDYYNHRLKEKTEEFIKDNFEIPQYSKIIFSKIDPSLKKIGIGFPIVRVKNIICLSGNPVYLDYGLISLEELGIFKRIYSNCVYIEKNVEDIPKHIGKTKAEFDVVEIEAVHVHAIDVDTTVIQVTFRSMILHACLKASAHFLNLFPPSSIHHSILGRGELFEIMDDLVKTFSTLSKPIFDSLEIIEQCFDKYGYTNVCVSFNGGKDCTVLLFLVYSVFMRKRRDPNEKLHILYIYDENSFFEVKLFIKEIEHLLAVNVIVFRDTVKKGLQQMVSVLRNLRAIFLGVRRSDPNMSEMKPFQMTDPSWPSIMRVSPILDWSYEMIWDFIRYLNIPYCCLYKEGYTSLGNKENTKKNDKLMHVDKGVVTYKPAFLLNDERAERIGRRGDN